MKGIIFVALLMLVAGSVVALSLPDLTIYSPQVSTMDMNGTKLLIINFQVKNIGQAVAPSSFVSINGLYSFGQSVPQLGIGRSYQIVRAYPCLMSHNITITADSMNRVNESNERNNIYSTFVGC